MGQSLNHPFKCDALEAVEYTLTVIRAYVEVNMVGWSLYSSPFDGTLAGETSETRKKSPKTLIIPEFTLLTINPIGNSPLLNEG